MIVSNISFLERAESIVCLERLKTYYSYYEPCLNDEDAVINKPVLWTCVPLVQHSNGTWAYLEYSVSSPRSDSGVFELVRIQQEQTEENVLKKVNLQSEKPYWIPVERPPLVFLLQYGSFDSLTQEAISRHFDRLVLEIEHLEVKKDVVDALRDLRDLADE